MVTITLPRAVGRGVPAGGLTGQVLVKTTGMDYDTRWATPEGGGSEGIQPPFLISYTTGLQEALNLKANLSDTIISVTTSRDLATTDNGAVLEVNSASAVTLTVPSTLPAGFNCIVSQVGAGQVTIAAGTSATVTAYQEAKTPGQWGEIAVRVRGTAGVAVVSGGAIKGGGSGGVVPEPQLPANLTPPAITGTPTVGQTLSVSNGTWTNSPTSFAYQWRRNGSNIAGATANTYALASDDAGTMISCLVTATNADGQSSSLTGELSVEAVSTAPRYIVGTDFAGDPDDALAFDVVLDAHKGGVINLIGVVADSSLETSAPGVKAMLKAHGYPAIPVYAYQGSAGAYNDNYSGQLRDRFGTPGETRAAYADDVTGYRTLLAGAPDGSVKIIGLGALTSLSRLLNSPADGISPLTGRQLVAAKVINLTQVGGNFPSSGTTPEYNLSRDIAASQNVYTNWPTPIIAHGFEPGSSVLSGPPYGADPQIDPAKYAFDLGQSVGYLSGNLKRSSWDPLAAHYAIYGPRTAYGFGGQNGTMTIDAQGNNVWSASPAGNVSYVSRIASTSALGRELDRIAAAVDLSNPAPDSDSFLLDFTEGTGRRSVGPNPNDIAYFGWESLTQIPVWQASVGPDFDGGDVAWMKHRPSYASQNIAFAAVVNLDSVASPRIIASRADGAGKQYWFLRLNAGKLEFVLFNSAQAGFPATSPTTDVATGTNVMVSFLLINGDTLVLRKNGVQVHAATLGAKLNPTVSDARLLFGARINSSDALADFMDGRLIASGFKANANASDLTTIEANLRAVSATKGIIIP